MNVAYKKTNCYKNECIDIRNYEQGIRDGLDIVNLGSTYSKFAFGTYDDLKLNGCDLSLQAQSLDVDYAILRQYGNKINKGGIVFITLAACCMLYEGNKNNPLYYKILNKKYNPKHSIKGRFESIFPLFVHPKRIKTLIKDRYLFANVYDSLPAQISRQQSETTAKSFAEGWIYMFGLSDLQHVDISDLNKKVIFKNMYILNDILNECFNRELIPVILIPPFTERLNKYYSKEFVDTVLVEPVRQVINGKNIAFLNYQWDKEFQNNYSLFVDGCFRLNEVGSKILIKKISKDMKKLGVIINNNNYGREPDYVREIT